MLEEIARVALITCLCVGIAAGITSIVLSIDLYFINRQIKIEEYKRRKYCE